MPSLSSFVHLRIHTEYSLIDGIVRIKPLMKAAVAMDMPAVAVTDENNLFAAIKFYQAALANGVKPILGVDLLLAHEQADKPPYRLTLLCQNHAGYLNLTKLVSRAYREGQQQGKVLLQKTWLTVETCDGLIALSGAREGDIGQAILNEQNELAASYLRAWLKLFPQRFYLELQRTGRVGESLYNQVAVELSLRFKAPVVATNDVHFIAADDFEAHEARVCIHDGYVLNDTRRAQRYSPQQYLRSAAEMAELFADLPEALTNSVEIAKRCNLMLPLGKSYLPNFPLPAGVTIEHFLTQEAEVGLQKRLVQLFPNQEEQQKHLASYQERLKIELDVINKMGFAGYFLIVSDFIRWSKTNHIAVGPGRGSGAGSLVAYALEITDLDPLRYDLLFERFLNPERISMPDFDIDFCMEGRDRVIDYVANKYGRDSVSQIITYGTMAAKAVVRDVGRVLGHPYGFVDKIAKLIPFELGITLEKALAQEADLRKRYEEEEEVRILIDLALKLEGIVRNAGKHAGGVVIAPSLLTDFTPLYCEPDGEHLVTQFDKDDVEAAGLVKFDFLGLRTLTIIDWTVKTINKHRAARDETLLDITLLPTDDQASFDLLKTCATTAIFQLESRGMKDLIKRLQPDNFEEIIALVALFRPGPLQSGMVDDFIDRKHGRAKAEYPHPELEPILRSTYGIILYQEQVMQIAQVLAGYTLGAADILRRAMGKKKPSEMAKQRTIFITGAEARGVDPHVANFIFDLMEKFAGYGFNKSHSAAYALVSYQTAWLKTHYPAEFMAAVLSSDMDNTDKVVGFVDECRRMKLDILPPDINRSHYQFQVIAANTIDYGLGAIKGAGETAINLIVQDREQRGPFKDLYDFCERLDLRKVNKRVLESLIRSGACDSFKIHRASLMMTLPAALQAAEQHIQSKAAGQHDLFGGSASSVAEHTVYMDLPEWSQEDRLRAEKETLGLYLSGHPLSSYEAELAYLTTLRLANIKPGKDQILRVAGLVVALRTMITRRGDRMAFVTLDDMTARVELAIFADLYEIYKPLIGVDALLIVEGEASFDEYTGGNKLSCKKIYSIDQAREIYAKRVVIKLHSQIDQSVVQKLAGAITPFKAGVCPIWIEYQTDTGPTQLVLGEAWRVKPCEALLRTLKGLVGEQQVFLTY